MKKEKPKVWIWSHWREPIPHYAYTDKNIEGINIAAYWQDLEPERGKLDLVRIIDDLRFNEINNKKSGLSVAAGAKCPNWLRIEAYNRGELLKFTELKKDGKAHLYNIEMPNPLKHSYLTAYRDFVENLSAQINRSGYVHNIQTVAISGANITTCEWRLPCQTPDEMGTGKVTDSREIWRSVGYYPESVVNLYNECRRIMVRNFPTAKLCTDICSGYEFPVLEDYKYNINDEILRACKNTSFPRRYYFKHTSLTPTNTGKLIQHIKEFGFFTVWQTNKTFFESEQATDDLFVQAMENARINEVDRVELQSSVYDRFKHLL
jgi:hypothetical protein